MGIIFVYIHLISFTCMGYNRGHDIYGIRTYSSLSPFLGEFWHVRVLNNWHDFFGNCSFPLV